jgi:hypothetical protein
MRKLLVGLFAAAVLAAPTTALADKPPVKGHFTTAFKAPGQPHRAYFRVAASQGSKECEVDLLKQISVTLGTDGESSLTHIFFISPSRATRAVAIANAILNEPTERVLCTH